MDVFLVILLTNQKPSGVQQIDHIPFIFCTESNSSTTKNEQSSTEENTSLTDEKIFRDSR